MVLIPSTPQESAWDYQVPLEAVLEALDHVAQNRPLIEQERDLREAAGFAPVASDGPAQARGSDSTRTWRRQMPGRTAPVSGA